LMAGQRDKALETIDEAIAVVEKNGDLFNIPELLRIKGNIVASEPQSDLGQAEAHFLRSLAMAKKNSALAWELRTTTSLALLWFRQDRLKEARGVLAPVVARFTEGFESTDFITAKRVLDDFGK
jgi:predicted ATPase